MANFQEHLLTVSYLPYTETGLTGPDQVSPGEGPVLAVARGLLRAGVQQVRQVSVSLPAEPWQTAGMWEAAPRANSPYLCKVIRLLDITTPDGGNEY